jgi:hypothetical protein
MHNFESVAPRYRRRSPLAARNNFQIALDGEAICREPQVGHEPGDVQTRRDFTGLAIDVYGHHLAHLTIGSLGLQLVTQLPERFGHLRADDQRAERGLHESGKGKVQ